MENNHFFKTLVNKRKIDEYSEVLDWLLNENRLSNFNANEKRKFTSRIKTYMKDKNIILAKFNYENEVEFKNKNEKYFLVSSDKGKSCEKLIKYIRNVIAHGACYLETTKNETIFVAKNIYKQHTLAFIRIPLSVLKDLYELYIELSNESIKEKEINNNEKVLMKV